MERGFCGFLHHYQMSLSPITRGFSQILWRKGLDPLRDSETLKERRSRMDLWTQWGRDRVGQMEKVASTYMCYHV